MEFPHRTLGGSSRCRPALQPLRRHYFRSPSIVGRSPAATRTSATPPIIPYNSKRNSGFPKGLWFLATYTWSKLLTDSDYIQASSLSNGLLGATGVISPYQRSRNKALSIDDVPNTFNFSTLYDLPVGRGKRFLNTTSGLVNRVLGGWQLSTLIKISSGTPYFFRSSNCNVPASICCRLHSLADCGCRSVPAKSEQLRSQPKGRCSARQRFRTRTPSISISATGRASALCAAPGFRIQDISIIKNIPLTERVGLRFQAEFFNAWNQHIFVCETRCFGSTAFDTDIASPTFGQWNGNVSTPRNIQFALKLMF